MKIFMKLHTTKYTGKAGIMNACVPSALPTCNDNIIFKLLFNVKKNLVGIVKHCAISGSPIRVDLIIVNILQVA
jgi:hypothetical protein